MKYVASPYTYGPNNKPTSWGIWNTETKQWTPNHPMPRKRDAEKLAKSMSATGI